MNTHTLAPTAPQSAGTPKTSATATVETATSATPQRIDDFIKQKLSVANSADGSGIIDSATRAARLGFAGAANVRYSSYLEAFRSSPQLTSMYSEKYPNSLFLPWPALHAVIKSLDLWVELPEHYQGAVPPEQLPWMEIFELDQEDYLRGSDIRGMLPRAEERSLRLFDWAVTDRWGNEHERFEANYGRKFDIELDPTERQRDIIQLGRMTRPVHDLWGQARESFFVVAPPDAFNTTEDWLSRLRRLMTFTATAPTVAPDDPLVIRFCHGGALVVAAWGDEAAYLNELTRELKL